MSLGRGDQVDRNMVASIEALGLLEKHSFDRLLPLFNVATNISTKIGYNKFCFVLLLRRVRVVEDQRHALRLFAVRVFRDEDAQKVRDILEPVRDAVLRRVFGGKFGSYVDRINHTEGVETGPEELDGDSLPDFIAKGWRRSTSEEVVPLIRFPSVYVYIVDPLARFETQVCDEIAGRAKKLVLRDLFASRDNYEMLLRKRISDPVFRDRERTVLAHLAQRTSRNKRGGSLDVTVEIDSKLASSSLLTNCPDYWNRRLSETASPSEIPSLLERKEETNNSEPQHQAFFDYTRQQRSRGHVGFLYASSDDRDRTESEYVAIWRHSLKSVDGRLFDDDRLDNEYPLMSAPSRSASFIAMAASCLHSVSLQVFLTRNKLNDIVRFVAVATEPRVYRRELDVARNFASYLDYSSFASEPLCRERCPHLFAEKILLPLEWLDNEIVVDALNSWSHSRLDIRFCPLEPFDQPRYILLQGSDKTESMLRWQEHAERVFESSSEVTPAAPSRYVSPSDFARFLRSRDHGQVVPTACTPAASPFFDIFLKKRRLPDQGPIAKRIKSQPSVWAVSLAGQLYDETAEENALIRVYCANKCPRNTGSFSRWKARGAEDDAKYVKALLTHWQKERDDDEERRLDEWKKSSTFCERTFSDARYNPYSAFLADHANSSPADSMEQLLFLQIFLKCASADFSILVNGNPGSGKTTIMNFLNDMLENQTLNLLPTNVLRERTKMRLERNGNVVNDPVVLTLSSFIKRNLRYNMSPDMYSRIIERYLAEQLERMSMTVRPMSVDRFLNPLSSPVDTLLYPPLVQIDEYNLSNFAEMELVSQICRTLQCVRVCFGDFAQGAPIRGTNDNAELIALRASLMVQFMDNKRLLATKSGGTTVRLTELLSDPVWNWRGNNCEDGITEYVRKLIDRCLCQPLRSRIDHDTSTIASKLRERIGDEFLAERTIRLNSEALGEWFDSTVSLMQWYDEKPCRRHVNSLDTLTDLVSRLAPLPLPCVISRRNYESDRVNLLVSTAICRYVDQACSDLAVRATKKEARSSFLPSCFYVVTRRACIANEESVSSNAASIKKSAYDADDMEPSGMPPSDLVIDDDPWCSSLTLILGAVYRFIGKWPEVLSTDTLLRLVAFLPSENDESRKKKKSPPQYFCDGSAPCDSECSKLRKQRQLIPRATTQRRRYTTRGCGGTCRAPRLLMRRINTRDDEDRTAAVCESDFVVIGRSCFKLTRCNSVWTPNMYTLNCARTGMVLYGYPLVMNCGISSWRVQGETIPRSDVYVDLRNMSRQQALVSLSRVRHHEQIRGVINLRFYGRSGDLAAAAE